MQKTTTLCEFLENTGAELRIYDMGRRVCEIPRDDFLAFENTAILYPLPMQQKAWFALVQIRQDTSNEPLIWFLRFDLEEQGKLVLATRDYFIHRFVELATGETGEQDLGAALEDNPFTFKPRDDKLANLNALVNHDLKKPASQYLDHARDYYAGKLGWDQWNFVGYQGIADLAARQSDSPVCRMLAESIDQLPNEPLVALCQCLENYPVNGALAEALHQRLQQALDSNDDDQKAYLLSALLRGLSRAPDTIRQPAIRQTLQHEIAANPEILAAIGGRAWESLDDPATLHAYIERLASEPVEQDIFNHCLADLMRMPGLRDRVLSELRAPDRSKRVAQAFQNMLA